MPIEVDLIPPSYNPGDPRYQVAHWYVAEAPSGYPVTWAEAKAQLRLDTDDQQAYVESLIAAATDFAEDQLGAVLMSRTVVATFYDGARLELPRGPVIEVLTVTDRDETAVTDYELENYGNTTRVIVGAHGGYPLTVTYTAGYTSAAAIPAAIRLAILTHVGTLHENRESVTDKQRVPVPHSLEDFYRLKSRRPVVA